MSSVSILLGRQLVCQINLTRTENSAGGQLVLVEGPNMLVKVELESGTVGAVRAGMRLLPGVGERVIPQALVLVAPRKHLVAEGTHQGPRDNALQHNTTVTTQPQHQHHTHHHHHTITSPAIHPSHTFNTLL